jgi:prepilin-type N-terminal cleavage/methylation domain-containing protein/prepilin-type processing-associated H-X9-DG protein
MPKLTLVAIDTNVVLNFAAEDEVVIDCFMDKKLKQGFSLIELLVVIAIIAILAALLLPSLAAAKSEAKKTICLNNLKQMQVAWIVYTDDFRDLIVDNTWVPGNMNSPADATNWMLLEEGLLYPYSPATAIYKCPADLKPNPKSLVVTVRSYSMNTYMNGYDIAAVLEDGQGLYTVQTKCSQIFSPPPARRLVFADECENSIDDCNFGVIPSMLNTDHASVNHWNNYPTARHNNAGTFSFADGHALAFKWTGQKLKALEAENVPGNYTADVSGPDLNDLRLVQAAMALPAGQN